MEHQLHFNRKFYKDLKTGYWISTDRPRTRAHRWVWISIHGLIPKGYHIHHKNDDKSDNSIENLELIEQSRHMRIHYTEEKKEWAKKWVDEIRPLTKAWHASEEGRAWHKLHALKCKFGKGDPVKYTCNCCGKSFESTKKARAFFCSNNCKSKFRRDEGLDDVEKKCPSCQSVFKSNKYAKTIYCCRACVFKK